MTSTQPWKPQGWSNPNTYPATVTILLCLILLRLSTASCSPFAYQKRPRPSTSKTTRNSCPRLQSIRFRLLLFYRLQWCWSKPTTHIRWQSWVYTVHSASSSFWLSSASCSPFPYQKRSNTSKTNRKSCPRLQSIRFKLLFFYCLQWCWSKPTTQIRWQSWVYSVHSASISFWLSSTGCSPLTNRQSFPRLRSRSFGPLFFYWQWCWSKRNTYPMASMSLLCLLLILHKLLGPFLPKSTRQLWSLTLTYRNAMFNRRKHRICDMPSMFNPDIETTMSWVWFRNKVWWEMLSLVLQEISKIVNELGNTFRVKCREKPVKSAGNLMFTREY